MFQRFIDFFTGLTPTDYSHPERIVENPLWLAEQNLHQSIHTDHSSMAFEPISTSSMDTMSYCDYNASKFEW